MLSGAAASSAGPSDPRLRGRKLKHLIITTKICMQQLPLNSQLSTNTSNGWLPLPVLAAANTSNCYLYQFML